MIKSLRILFFTASFFLVLQGFISCGKSRTAEPGMSAETAVLSPEPPATVSAAAQEAESVTEPVSDAASIQDSPAPGIEALAAGILEEAVVSDFTRLNELAAEAESAGMMESLILELERQASLPDAPPAFHVALSALYGRKGFKTKEYAALAAAEEAAKRPGVAFNIALVHGRKKLLEGSADADGFIVGNFDIASEPAGAAVFLDGKPAGSSPVRLEKIKAGAHSIRLELSGYDPWSADFNLGVGKTVALVETLRAKPALLALKVVPSGAVVKIDGNPVSITNPVTLEHGTHELTIEETNSKKIVEALSVNPGESVSRSYTMEPAVFNWSFDTTPRGGIVSLDGKEIGIAPIENYPVVAGKHQVTVNLDKYEVLNETRSFDGGNFSSFSHNFYLVRAPYKIQTKTIRLKNKEDWDGIEPVPMNDLQIRDTMPNVAGNTISRVALAQDKQYVYWLMEFSDGTPSVKTGVSYSIMIQMDPVKSEKHIALKLGSNGNPGTLQPHLPYNPPGKTDDWQDMWNNSGSNADYVIGAGYIVARFPRASILKTIKAGSVYKLNIGTYLEEAKDNDGKWSGFELAKAIL